MSCRIKAVSFGVRTRLRNLQKRNVVEPLAGRLKEFHRVAMRYEKLTPHYLAIAKIAMNRLLLRRRFVYTV